MSGSKQAKQIIVMRTDLNMRKGKMIAQGAHSSIAWMTNRLTELKPSSNPPFPEPPFWVGSLSISDAEKAWIKGNFAKICVRVDSEDELLTIHQMALDAKLTSYLITDSGLTEFHGIPTNTCCAIGPNWGEDVDKITGDLKLL